MSETSQTTTDTPATGTTTAARTPVPEKGQRHRVRQVADRADYDRETIDAIIDACPVGHVSFLADDWPMSIPLAIGRIGDHLYLHGSRSSRLLGALSRGARVSVSFCLLDGLVKARSAFHCSMNYRSVVVIGETERVPDAEKAERLFELTEALLGIGREHYRDHLAKELKATELVRLSLAQASAKIRAGEPIDDAEDLSLPHWAGVMPLAIEPGAVRTASDLIAGIDIPTAWVR